MTNTADAARIDNQAQWVAKMDKHDARAQAARAAGDTRTAERNERQARAAERAI